MYLRTYVTSLHVWLGGCTCGCVLHPVICPPPPPHPAGQIAMSKLICRLPFGSHHQGLSEQTVVAVLCALIELVSESAENIR